MVNLFIQLFIFFTVFQLRDSDDALFLRLLDGVTSKFLSLVEYSSCRQLIKCKAQSCYISWNVMFSLISNTLSFTHTTYEIIKQSFQISYNFENIVPILHARRRLQWAASCAQLTKEKNK